MNEIVWVVSAMEPVMHWVRGDRGEQPYIFEEKNVKTREVKFVVETGSGEVLGTFDDLPTAQAVLLLVR